MSKKPTLEMTKSCGNVFEDLGLPNSEELLVKVELAFKINQLIESRNLKQKDAAFLLKIDQPKISALSRGRLSGFSVERLFKFLKILNQDIEIVIKPHIENKRHNTPYVNVRYASA